MGWNTVPQIALIHAENVLKAHEVFLGHLEEGKKCRTKQILLLAGCGKHYGLRRPSILRAGSILCNKNLSLPTDCWKAHLKLLFFKISRNQIPLFCFGSLLWHMVGFTSFIFYCSQSYSCVSVSGSGFTFVMYKQLPNLMNTFVRCKSHFYMFTQWAKHSHCEGITRSTIGSSSISKGMIKQAGAAKLSSYMKGRYSPSKMPNFTERCCCVENHLSHAQCETRSQLQLLPSELFDKQLGFGRTVKDTPVAPLLYFWTKKFFSIKTHLLLPWQPRLSPSHLGLKSWG